MFNEACNDISQTAFNSNFPNQYELHKLVYYSIRERDKLPSQLVVRHKQRYVRLSWAFNPLRSYIEYKARVSGVPIKTVNTRNTSRECPNCHAIDKGNRKDRNSFKCVRCGYGGEADYVASLNIRSRAAVNQPIVA